jgi:hypothetical protein
MKIQEIANSKATDQQSPSTDTIHNSATTETSAIVPRLIQLKLVNTSKQHVVERDGTHYLVWQLTITDLDGVVKEVELLKELDDDETYIYSLESINYTDNYWTIDHCVKVLIEDIKLFIKQGYVEGRGFVSDGHGFTVNNGKLNWANVIGKASIYLPYGEKQEFYDDDDLFCTIMCTGTCENFTILKPQYRRGSFEEITAVVRNVFAKLDSLFEDDDDIKEAFIAKVREVFNLDI